MKVYAIRFNNNEVRLICSNQYLARQALAFKKEAIRRRLISIDDETEDHFSFHFGWEGHGGTWKIQEMEVVTDLSVAKYRLGE